VTRRQLAWFVALYAAGALAVLALGGVLRLLLGL
jgi:hypothetical protein